MPRRRTAAPGPGQLALPLQAPLPLDVQLGWRSRWRDRRIVTIPTHGLT